MLCQGNAGIWGFRVAGHAEDRRVEVRDGTVTAMGEPVPEEARWVLRALGDDELIGWAVRMGFDPGRFDADDIWVVTLPP